MVVHIKSVEHEGEQTVADTRVTESWTSPAILWAIMVFVIVGVGSGSWAASAAFTRLAHQEDKEQRDYDTLTATQKADEATATTAKALENEVNNKLGRIEERVNYLIGRAPKL